MPASPKKSVEELEKLQQDLLKYSKMPGWEVKIKAELKGPVEEAERKVKAKIASIPSHTIERGRRGGQRTSLRRSMIRATKSGVGNKGTVRDIIGGFVWVDAHDMPSGQENLPAYMEGIRRYTRWRHMIFGNEESWMTQRAHPYFRRTVRPYEAKGIVVAEKVIDQVKREFERG